MLKNPKEIYAELSSGVKAFSRVNADCISAFNKLGAVALKSGALNRKTKELMAVAISLAIRCDYCIVAHVHGALEAGATRQELIETAAVCCFMGGGPAVAYSSALFQDTIDAFAPDFEKS